MVAYFGAELNAQERQRLANGVAGHDPTAGHGGLGWGLDHEGHRVPVDAELIAATIGLPSVPQPPEQRVLADPRRGRTYPAGDEQKHEEHAAARRRAYFLAMERGGGQLPTYDPDEMHDDFCKAAGLVTAMRRGPGKEATRG
jgi:hypothetical protein